MIYTGCHLSSAKGFEAMGKNALKLGADTFAFFTRNPRGGNAKAIDPADAARFRELAAKHHFGKIVAHAPYTLNPCGAKEEVRDFAFRPSRRILSGWSTSREIIIIFTPEAMWARERRKASSSLPTF